MSKLAVTLVAVVLCTGCAHSHMAEMQARAQAEAHQAELHARAEADAAAATADMDAAVSAEELAAMEAMMAAWTAHMTPGEHHAHLMARAGAYDTTFTWWEAPGMPPGSAHGTAVLSPVLGGLFLAEDSRSSEMIPGVEWHGMGFTGYDNTADKLVMVWIDNTGSGMYFAQGHCNDDCTETVAEGTGTDAMSGTTEHYRYVTRDLESGDIRFQIWERGADGGYWLMMQAEYARRG